MCAQRIEREMRLLKEYIAQTYPNSLAWFRVRLGPYPESISLGAGIEVSGKVKSVYNRWADAVVIDGEMVLLFEAKIRSEPGALAQLELYRKLLPETPEFASISQRIVQPVLLSAFPDPEVDAMARDKGFWTRIYTPDWVKRYWEELQFKKSSRREE